MDFIPISQTSINIERLTSYLDAKIIAHSIINSKFEIIGGKYAINAKAKVRTEILTAKVEAFSPKNDSKLLTIYIQAEVNN